MLILGPEVHVGGTEADRGPEVALPCSSQTPAAPLDVRVYLFRHDTRLAGRRRLP